MTKMPSFSVDPSLWRAVMGSSVEIPPVNTHVYYFPEGHLERIQSSSSATILNYNFTLSRPFIPCQLLSVRFLSDPSSDKLFVVMILRPTFPRPCHNNNNDAKSNIENDVVSFSKSLTQSDANNGGGFSIPKFCAEMIFPRLQSIAASGDTPGQDLKVTDPICNHAWAFRHTYRGTPRRHILSTGWSQYLKSKRLSTGDTVVFMKKKSTDELFVGVRRRGRAHQIEGGSPEALEAVRRAVAGMEFEVVYYPEFGWPDFVVRAEKVEDALKIRWTAGMKVRMVVDGDDLSQLSWFQGVVAAATSLIGFRSPWRMLQVNWEEPEVLLHRRVCPWQVEHIPLIEPYFLPSSKKLKAQHALTLLPESSFQGDSQKKDNEDQQPGSSAVVSTILSIGSSWSESDSVHDNRLDNPELLKNAQQPAILSIGSSRSESEGVNACTTDSLLGNQHGNISTFRLFGQMIEMSEPVGNTTS